MQVPSWDARLFDLEKAATSKTYCDEIKGTLKEQGVNVELGNWRGVFGGPNITAAQRDALVKAVKAATESPQWKDTLQKTGWAPWFLGGDDYKKFVDEDVKRVGAIIESLGLQKK